MQLTPVSGNQGMMPLGPEPSRVQTSVAANTLLGEMSSLIFNMSQSSESEANVKLLLQFNEKVEALNNLGPKSNPPLQALPGDIMGKIDELSSFAEEMCKSTEKGSKQKIYDKFLSKEVFIKTDISMWAMGKS